MKAFFSMIRNALMSAFFSMIRNAQRKFGGIESDLKHKTKKLEKV